MDLFYSMWWNYLGPFESQTSVYSFGKCSWMILLFMIIVYLHINLHVNLWYGWILCKNWISSHLSAVLDWNCVLVCLTHHVLTYFLSLRYFVVVVVSVCAFAFMSFKRTLLYLVINKRKWHPSVFNLTWAFNWPSFLEVLQKLFKFFHPLFRVTLLMDYAQISN